MQTTTLRLVGAATLAWAAVVHPAGASSHYGEDPYRHADALERRANELEEAGAGGSGEVWLEASNAFEALAVDDPVGSAYWRAARAAWLAADILPVEEKKQRIELFERAHSLAQKGLDANERCAGCMLWMVGSLGRLGTARGVWHAARSLPEIAELLDRGIALGPTRTDKQDNSTLGNLHYASAIFYRVLPDWLLMRLLLGVRGDKERALRHIRSALALHPRRIDYQVELGAQLVCLGTSKDDDTRLSEGHAVLRDALAWEQYSLDAKREKQAARIMLEGPEKSCGYTGDAWIEIDRDMQSSAMGG